MAAALPVLMRIKSKPKQAQSLSDALNELANLGHQCESIKQELTKVRNLGFKQVLCAPVSGTVTKGWWPTPSAGW